MDLNVVKTLWIFSFMVAVATQAPSTGNKGTKSTDTGKVFTGKETFRITLHWSSGVDEPLITWNVNEDMAGDKIPLIISHLRAAGGHDHDGGHGGHGSHNMVNKGKLTPTSVYQGLEIEHFQPGIKGSHGYIIGTCEFPALEYNIIRYTSPSGRLSGTRKDEIFRKLIQCVRNSNQAKPKKQGKMSNTRKVHDGHPNHKH